MFRLLFRLRMIEFRQFVESKLLRENVFGHNVLVQDPRLLPSGLEGATSGLQLGYRQFRTTRLAIKIGSGGNAASQPAAVSAPAQKFP